MSPPPTATSGSWLAELPRRLELGAHARRVCIAFALGAIIVALFPPTPLSWRTVIGGVVLQALLILPLGVVLALYRPSIYASYRALLGIALCFVFVLVLTRVVLLYIPSYGPFTGALVPIGVAGLTLGVLLDARTSMLATIMLALLIGQLPPFLGQRGTILCLLGGAVSAWSVRSLTERRRAYVAIGVLFAGYAVASVAVTLVTASPLGDVSAGITIGWLNSVVSVALALLLLPIVESVSGIDTYFSLLEWSDLNRPLMRRLSLEAPGTFAHTLATAQLAEQACAAIGANGLLVRVGAYYHDIGKVTRPPYFVENQSDGQNPHDRLTPTESAAIIRGHVGDGLRLAEAHRVPRAIRAFIAEHHGTEPIAYFAEKARGIGDDPNAMHFRYAGPLPQSAESAIFMLADRVEAATRGLRDRTPERVREVVEKIVRRRVESGQLREAPLTLAHIEHIKASFVRTLTSMHHNRIDYPSGAMERITRESAGATGAGSGAGAGAGSAPG
ncbi:MAG TPA: HDIG domain-containing protein [Gemmatimonadaceae bacterium]|nr:HDIG domain-containing protein [Gemmatimonadaceae bacterium]